MRYQTVDSFSGEIVRESDNLIESHIRPRKHSYTKSQPGIHLSYKEAWIAGLLVFLVGVWFAQ